jgi:hypothetical protein
VIKALLVSGGLVLLSACAMIETNKTSARRATCPPDRCTVYGPVRTPDAAPAGHGHASHRGPL